MFVRRTRNNLTNCYTNTRIPDTPVEMPSESKTMTEAEFKFGSWEKTDEPVANDYTFTPVSDIYT